MVLSALHMALRFECSVCCSECKETKKVECPGCNYKVCVPCQKQYGKVECMDCRSLFATTFAVSVLGAKFVHETAKQTVLSELMVQQRRELETVGDLVTWTKQCREIKKSQRFGVRVRLTRGGETTSLPVKPVRFVRHVTCPCPVNDCRGAVIQSMCNVCRTAVCTECLCITSDHHTCDPSTLESVREIRANTKPCPRCSSLIFKTEGCDHMHCTNCNTHFSYNHLTILTSTTNYHYRERLIRGGLHRMEEEEDLAQVCAVSLENDRIPESVLMETMEDVAVDTDLLEALYKATRAVRFLRNTEYKEIEISRVSRERYDELQVQFAMQEITDKEWEQKVYRTFSKQQSCELIAGILHLFLSNTDGMQSELYHALRTKTADAEFLSNLRTKLETLIDIVNANILDIRNDLDPTSATVLHLRQLAERNVPFCAKKKIIQETAKRVSPSLTNAHVHVEEPTMEPIQLYAYQEEHVERITKIFQQFHFALDMSPLGTGKTYAAAKVFQMGHAAGDFRHLVTISPPSVKTKWLQVNKEYHMKMDANLMYGEITGKRLCSPKCNLLTRNDYTVEVPQENGTTRNIDKYNYTVTDIFERWVQEGLLLVIDEFQNIKNECAQTEACETMIREIYKRNTKSRVLMLSGSPIDKEEQAVRLYKTLGIMRHPKIVSGYQFAGINEIVKYLHAKCRTREAQPGNLFIQQTLTRYVRYEGGNYLQLAWSCTRYAYQLFLEVLKPRVSSIMAVPASTTTSTGVEIVKYNGFFKLNEEKNRENMERAILELQKLEELQETMRLNQANAGAALMQQMVMALSVIETAKVDTFVRLARRYLETNRQGKVVLAVNYSSTIADLKTQLSEYEPLVLDGSKTIVQRVKILEKFQASNSERRLLLGNVRVLSVGIDLDDKEGGYPRECYISPNSSTMEMYQLRHRFKRGMETRSSTKVYMVYSEDRRERQWMERLRMKESIMTHVSSLREEEMLEYEEV